jgi:hypothetical protein
MIKMGLAEMKFLLPDILIASGNLQSHGSRSGEPWQ